jgi:S1-C subfamily serine protease
MNLIAQTPKPMEQKIMFKPVRSLAAKLMALVVAITFTYGKTKAQNDADMLDKAIGSVVTVAVYKTDEAKKALGFRDKKTNAQKAYEKLLDMGNNQISGSGFVIEKNGKKYVITNAHVVEEASEEANSLYVFSIDRTKYEVKIVGGDSYFDFAVLEFITPPGKEISAIKFAAKAPRIGDKVFAIGNPLGEYPYTVTDGIVSAKNRVRNGITGKFGFIQSTATVIWGNSGGPLVNNKGEVVGMNSQIAFAQRGDAPLWQPQINFALESEICDRLLNDVTTNNGLVRRAYVGIEVAQSFEYVEWMSWFGGSPWVATDTLPVIRNVIPGSPAASVLANKVGAQIYSVNGITVRNNNEVFGEFEKARPGENIKLTLVTKNGKEDVEIKTTEISTRNLEQLATFVLEGSGQYKLLKNDDGSVAVRNVTTEEPVASLGTRGGKSNMSKGGIKQLSDFEKGTTYQLLSAGVAYTNYTSKYRVKKLSDLGAALRLTGETGNIQLFVIDQDDAEAEPMSITFDLSGSQEISQNTLWY